MSQDREKDRGKIEGKKQYFVYGDIIRQGTKKVSLYLK